MVPRFENFSIGIWSIWKHYVFPFTFSNVSLDYVGLNLFFNVLQLTLFQQLNLIKVVTILLLVIAEAVLFSLRGQIQKMCVLFPFKSCFLNFNIFLFHFLFVTTLDFLCVILCIAW